MAANATQADRDIKGAAAPDAGTDAGSGRRSTVAVVRSETANAGDIRYDEIRSMVENAAALAGGLEGLIKDGQTVVIKPNLISSRDFCLPDWGGKLMEKEVNGVTADWRVTKAVVELVRRLNPGGRVYIMEGSIIDTRGVMEHLHYTPEYIPGVDEFIPIEKDSGAWQDKNSGGLVRVVLPRGLLHKEYYLNKKYMEADLLISIPCLKNHWNACVTGAVKNVGLGATPASIYGIDSGNPARNNMVDHETSDLHAWIHDYYLCRPVDFVVMDGLQGLQNGPVPSFVLKGTTDMKVDQMNMGLILAGRDAVAVDTVESLIMNWDPLSVPYLTQLEQSGAGVADVSRITVAGCRVDEVRRSFDGLIPPAGGCRAPDKKAPETSVGSYAVKGGVLRFSLITGGDTVKAEVHIDGKPAVPAFSGDFRDCAVDIGAGGRHEVKIHTFDRFLNRCENVIIIEA